MLKILQVGIVMCAFISCTSNNTANNVSQNPADYKKAALLNVQMGETYFARGQSMRAKAKFLHALELQPKMPEVHSAMAYYYENIGEDELALQYHKNAIRYGDGQGGFYNNYGTFLCNKKHYQQADVAFNQALNDPKYIQTGQIYENAGNCALQANKVAKAQMYFTKAINHEPERADVLLSLADCDYKLGHYTQAKHHLDEYMYNRQHNSKSLFLSVLINNKLNNKDLAASDALKLKSLFPASAETIAYKKMVSNGNN
jgi:type IV pilus assembly protein PilF